MNKIIFTSIVLMFYCIGKAQTNYYVSRTGNNTNSGLSESTAWRTIAYALSSSSPVMAGDTIFIKAGNYENENVVIEKNGTVSAPIVIEGYQVTPGDNPNLNYSFGDNLDESIMPLLDGLDRSTGIAIDINGSKNIIINNIQIKNYEYGIIDHTYTYDLNTKLNNIIVKDIGDTTDSYSGKAIEFYSSNNVINNCIVVNASAQGILVEGDYNTIENCKVYCDDSSSVNAAMDYYIVVYNGNHNTIQNCYVERVGDLPHYGHGIGLKGDCENNSIRSCTAKNFRGEAFYVRHRGAINNIFTNCVAIGVTEGATGFIVRDGASNNQFNNCIVDNCKRGLMFYDSTEDNGAQYCGRNNFFNNCIIKNTEIGIDFNDYEVFSDIDSNFFNNCVFYNGITLINVERNNFNNKMTNCIVSNYYSLKRESNGYSLSFEFNYCDFYNNGFTMPQGTGNISSNPQFVDATNSDFHLMQNSPCIDAGTSSNAPNFDFEGTSRPQGSGFDIGAYEYSNETGVNEQIFKKNYSTQIQLSTKYFYLNNSIMQFMKYILFQVK